MKQTEGNLSDPGQWTAGIRRWGWLVILGMLVGMWVLNASRVGRRPEGCPDGCTTVARRRAGPLRVMSLNVLHGFPRFEHLSERLNLIANEIQRQDADIVCLQEVPWRPGLGSAAAYLGRRTGLNDLYLRANGNRYTILFQEGEAILSRYPLREVRFTELEPKAGFFEHRVVLGATAVTPWGELHVFSTHLTNGEPAINRAQAASLRSFVEAAGAGPAIVAGDFNATEDTSQIQDLARRWVDTYRAIHPEEAGFTCCVDDLTHGPDQPLEKRIDYIFFVPATGRVGRVVGSRRVLDRPFRTGDGWLWASDHVGLLTAIEAYTHSP
jgi:endonuclease/exonuclease/phosphatase family metal-dependent hydrolase